jgi:hypothetical protein
LCSDDHCAISSAVNHSSSDLQANAKPLQNDHRPAEQNWNSMLVQLSCLQELPVNSLSVKTHLLRVNALGVLIVMAPEQAP